MAIRLPLFPLGSVLVPGLVLPLQIFEPRYRALVRTLLDEPDEEQRRFGVIALRSGQEAGDDGPPDLFEVGCTAQVQEVTPHADGRYDLVSVGEDRFRLLELLPDAGTPFHTGLVELLPEVDLVVQDDGSGEGADVAAATGGLERLADLVALRFAAYRERLAVEQTGVPTDPRVLSYLVAAATVLDLPERQTLLAADSTADRLQLELALLRREIGLLDAFGTLPAVDLARTPVAPN